MFRLKCSRARRPCSRRHTVSGAHSRLRKWGPWVITANPVRRARITFLAIFERLWGLVMPHALMLMAIYYRAACQDVRGAPSRTTSGAGYSQCLCARTVVERRAFGLCLRDAVGLSGSPGVLGHAIVCEAWNPRAEVGNQGEDAYYPYFNHVCARTCLTYLF